MAEEAHGLSELRSQDAREGAYRGPDRRDRDTNLPVSLPAVRVVPTAMMIGGGVAIPALFLILRDPSVSATDGYLAMAAGLLCSVAGATLLVTWRVAGTALQGWAGSAFVVLGIMTIVSNGVSHFGVGPIPADQPADELIGTVIVAWLLWRGLSDEQVNAGFSPLLNLLVPTGLGTAAMGLLNVAEVHGLAPGLGTAPLVAALEGTGALVWLAIGCIGYAQIARGSGTPPWITVVACFIGGAFVIRGVEPMHATWRVVASACVFAAAAFAASAAVVRLQGVLKNEERWQFRLHRAMEASHRQVESEHEHLDEWLHDLRNAVAGLRAADARLRAGGLEEHAELDDAVTAELARLHELVEADPDVSLVDVRLAELVKPLVAAEAALGARIVASVGGVTVRADRNALARAVQNVLANARQHAPGTQVVVRAERHEDTVRLTVRDGGSGLAPQERDRMFERGVRGALSTGTPGAGLGLYVARSLLRTMGGEIDVVADDVPGCCVVITLPSASEHSAVPDAAPGGPDAEGAAGHRHLKPAV